jgi:alpha-ketoglutarate-dependent 2,4-dichlorophenoxyacetate dioxygenase
MAADGSTLRITPLHPTFVAQIEGIDWTVPISDAVFAEIKKAIDKYGVLVFRNANIDNETQVAFTSRFGEMDYMLTIHIKGRFPHQPQIFDLSNMDEQGNIIQSTNRFLSMSMKGNQLWHADMQYHPHRDQYSILRGVEIPPPGVGGETEFADSRTAYEALSPEWKERVENMVINCSLIHNRRTGAPNLYKGVDPMAWPTSRWKAVYPHEGSGRKNLYVTSYSYKIDDTSVEKSQKIIGGLIAHGTQPQFVYKLSWENPGDMIMWDNTAVWHRARDDSAFQHMFKRDMRRTNTFDDGPHGWGENDPKDNWRVKVPKDPYAHEKVLLDAAPEVASNAVKATA